MRFETYLDLNGTPQRGAQWEIVTINPDGSGEQIISAGEPGSTRTTQLEEDRGPSWSPDSARLVFTTQSMDPCCPPMQIVEVGRDGTGLVTLSDNPEFNDAGPSYSPDGTLIVFSSDRGGPSPGSAFDLYTMPAPQAVAAGLRPLATPTVVTRLTSLGNATDPSWGRDPGNTEPPGTFRLTVSVQVASGAGGLVVSWPPGIVCGRDCSQEYPAGTLVALVAVPLARSQFDGWSGACDTRSLVCIVTMDEAQSVTTKFVRRRR